MYLFVLLTCALITTSRAGQFRPLVSLQKQVARWKRVAAATLIAPASILLLAGPSNAAETANVYFGVGCFWHVQHEFVEAERSILGRSDNEITSYAGYAGGTKAQADKRVPGSKGIVCYHNLLGIAEYGNLGHGEVVSMKIPDDKVKDFAAEYFMLFGTDSERPDKGDRGPEYRSLLGLPGGINSPLYPQVEAALKVSGKELQLKAGSGNDPDTLGKKTVWVMDTETFPFYAGEVYHQFHDGFMPGEGYPESYNSLVKEALKDGRIGPTGCPDTI